MASTSSATDKLVSGRSWDILSRCWYCWMFFGVVVELERGLVGVAGSCLIDLPVCWLNVNILPK